MRWENDENPLYNNTQYSAAIYTLVIQLMYPVVHDPLCHIYMYRYIYIFDDDIHFKLYKNNQ